MPGIIELSPSIFLIGFDGWLVLCKCQSESNIAIEMAIWQVMYDLSDCPTARAVWGIELLGRQSLDGSPKSGGHLGDLIDQALPLLSCIRSVVLELADGVAQVHLIGSCLYICIRHLNGQSSAIHSLGCSTTMRGSRSSFRRAGSADPAKRNSNRRID